MTLGIVMPEEVARVVLIGLDAHLLIMDELLKDDEDKLGMYRAGRFTLSQDEVAELTEDIERGRRQTLALRRAIMIYQEVLAYGPANCVSATIKTNGTAKAPSGAATNKKQVEIRGNVESLKQNGNGQLADQEVSPTIGSGKVDPRLKEPQPDKLEVLISMARHFKKCPKCGRVLQQTMGILPFHKVKADLFGRVPMNSCDYVGGGFDLMPEEGIMLWDFIRSVSSRPALGPNYSMGYKCEGCQEPRSNGSGKLCLRCRNGRRKEESTVAIQQRNAKSNFSKGLTCEKCSGPRSNSSASLCAHCHGLGQMAALAEGRARKADARGQKTEGKGQTVEGAENGNGQSAREYARPTIKTNNDLRPVNGLSLMRVTASRPPLKKAKEEPQSCWDEPKVKAILASLREPFTELDVSARFERKVNVHGFMTAWLAAGWIVRSGYGEFRRHLAVRPPLETNTTTKDTKSEDGARNNGNGQSDRKYARPTIEPNLDIAKLKPVDLLEQIHREIAASRRCHQED